MPFLFPLLPSLPTPYFHSIHEPCTGVSIKYNFLFKPPISVFLTKLPAVFAVFQIFAAMQCPKYLYLLITSIHFEHQFPVSDKSKTLKSLNARYSFLPFLKICYRLSYLRQMYDLAYFFFIKSLPDFPSVSFRLLILPPKIIVDNLIVINSYSRIGRMAPL